MKILLCKDDIEKKSYKVKFFVDVSKFGLQAAKSLQNFKIKGFVIIIQGTTFWDFFDPRPITYIYLHIYV